MSETDAKKRIDLPVSRLHSDNLGDLLADGTVHIDEVCDRAVKEEQRKQAREEAADIYDDPDWEPPYTHVAEDF